MTRALVYLAIYAAGALAWTVLIAIIGWPVAIAMAAAWLVAFVAIGNLVVTGHADGGRR